jgi:hypothetical protein
LAFLGTFIFICNPLSIVYTAIPSVVQNWLGCRMLSVKKIIRDLEGSDCNKFNVLSRHWSGGIEETKKKFQAV